MDLNKFAEEMKISVQKAYPQDEITDNLWNQLKTQVASGYVFGLTEEQLIVILDPKLNYFKRELVMVAYALEMAPDLILEFREKIRASDDSVKDNVIMLLKMWNENAVNENVLSIETNMSEMMELYRKQIEAMNQEKTEITKLNQDIRTKDEEIQKLNNSISEMEKKISDREKEIEQEIKERAKVLAEKIAEDKIKAYIFNEEVKRQDAEILERKIREEYEEKYGNAPKAKKNKRGLFGKNKVEVPRELRIKPLPKGFNLAAYICGSDLSSSQMEIITIAVRLGVNESLIKQMIDSKKTAAQMKQTLEIIVTQMQAEQNESFDIPEGIKYELFDDNLES